MKKDYLFLEAYLKILNEQSSPTTFTPEELLYDAVKECYYSTGEIVIYTIDQIEAFCDSANKPLFSRLAKSLKHTEDYVIVIVYFPDVDSVVFIFSKERLLLPGHHYGVDYSKFKEAFKKFFEDDRNVAANFNSIDVMPELGCVIGLNGSKIKSNRDFEKELDHELNHYFEQMNVHFNEAVFPDKIALNQYVVDEICRFYGVALNKKSFIEDLKKHLFDEEEFRSISANVFHEILRHNETHLKDICTTEIVSSIESKNWSKYSRHLQEMLLFCWVCRELSNSRWLILLNGIEAACSHKKNIFQKSYIAGKDILRRIVVKAKETMKNIIK